MVGDIAHVCNRGVEKRRIFVDTNDYLRFRDNLFLLNNKSGKIRTKRKNIFASNTKIPKRDMLVDILKWSLLPNHFHLLLHENIEGGILEFTKRLGNAYTKYFNTKNQGRSGYLFQNSAKIIRINDDRHFLYIPFYIDLNPLELSSDRNINFLKLYKWSSFRDYFNDGRCVNIVNQDLFYDIADTNPDKYYHEVKELLKHKVRLDELNKSVNLPG